MTADLAAWLVADDGPIAEDEAWARAAAVRPTAGPPAGEHWQWECTECDTVLEPDPAADEHLHCPRCGSFRVSLRSRETYPSSVAGPLPSFAITYAEEQAAGSGGHIAQWSPARVLAECAAKRQIIETCQHGHELLEQDPNDPEIVGWSDGLSDAVRALAQPYAGRPGWRDEWRTT